MKKTKSQRASFEFLPYNYQMYIISIFLDNKFELSLVFTKYKTQEQYLRYCSLDFPLKIQLCGYLTKRYIFIPYAKIYTAES